MGGEWRDPTSHVVYGDGNPWNNPEYSYDGDPATRAGCTLWIRDSSETIEYELEPIYSDRVHFTFTWTTGGFPPSLYAGFEIWAKVDGEWSQHTRVEGALDQGQWVLYFTEDGGFTVYDIWPPPEDTQPGWLTGIRIKTGFRIPFTLQVQYLNNVQGYAIYPSVNFSADPVSCCEPLTVTFTNTTTQPPFLMYDWDFGDGTSHSAFPNPIHVYENAGTYSVTLIVTGKNGPSELTKTNYITVKECATIIKHCLTQSNVPMEDVWVYLLRWDEDDEEFYIWDIETTDETGTVTFGEGCGFYRVEPGKYTFDFYVPIGYGLVKQPEIIEVVSKDIVELYNYFAQSRTYFLLA